MYIKLEQTKYEDVSMHLRSANAFGSYMIRY